MTSSRPCSHGRRQRRRAGPAATQAQGKTLFAFARKLIPQVIGEAFAEAHRRDPGHVRPMLAVVDGNNVRLREPLGPACADTGCSDRVCGGGRNGSVRRQSEEGWERTPTTPGHGWRALVRAGASP
jgi:hypothetical protein